MGINAALASLLVGARLQGAAFSKTATIGRLRLRVPLDRLHGLADRLKRDLPGWQEPDWPTFSRDGYAEDFFRCFLGADVVRSFDCSTYQGADIAHDFNRPLPSAHHGRFDAVVDGGTLEHIFDVKQTLSNYTALVRVGGHVMINTTANNFCGHGFYQFSPEFFFRVFDERNGFQLDEVILMEAALEKFASCRTQRCYRAEDPAKTGRRLLLVNDKPVLIFANARRVGEQLPFAHPPAQSDYRAQWSTSTAYGENQEPPKPKRPQTKRPTGRAFRFGSPLKQLTRRLAQRRESSFWNRRRYRRFDP
ncbi:MAG: hypothetical protein ACR2RA_15335 [Geminicoccaceae bacterium]